MKKILIVEDEEAIEKYLTKFLQKENFAVDALATGINIAEYYQKNQPDLIILDVMLPGKDGITCCKELREISDVPIIMLTAKVEEIDRIIGLRAGADDYVCKPFSAVELVLRIQQILKRSEKPIIDNSFLLNVQNFQISHQGKVAELTQLEFALFQVLYNCPHRIFSRDEIIERAYPDRRDIFDRAIDSHVKNIRKKIKSLALEETVIDSVYGAGYRYLPKED
jgi:two-component system response regulator BaeR